MEYGEFYTFEKGKTARIAFDKAKAKADKIHKGDSHSCSLVQKEDFIEFESSITRTNDIAEKLLNDMHTLENTATTREEMIYAMEKKIEIKSEKSWFRNRSKRTGKDKAMAIAHLLIGIEHDLINEPKKPAGIIQVLKNEWLIFGLANE